MSDCLFCKISAGEIPSNKVYEDDLCYAFYDIAPQAPVHFLVIPKAHIASVSAVTAENSAVVAHIFVWRATAWCPTSGSRRDRACSTCTSMCCPAGI